jgi:hypothetical protein
MLSLGPIHHGFIYLFIYLFIAVQRTSAVGKSNTFLVSEMETRERERERERRASSGPRHFEEV